MGKSTINGLFSIAMLNYQRVNGLERGCSMVPPKRTDNIQLARNEDGIHNGSRYPKHDFQEIQFLSIWNLENILNLSPSRSCQLRVQFGDEIG